MKKLALIMLAVVSIALVSCGGSGKKGSIKPVSEKITGPLGAYFEVVSKDYVPTDRGNVSIELRRVQAGFPEPWNSSMKVGYSDGCFEPLFTAEFQDEDGNVLSKDKTDIVWDRDDLEALAALQVDETCTLGFDVGRDNPRQVRLSSTFEVHGISQSSALNESDVFEETIDVNAYIYDDDGDFTNIRNRPKGAVIDKIPCGQGRFGVYLDKESNGWWHIKDSKVYDTKTDQYRELNGDDCWIHKSIVKFEKESLDDEDNDSDYDFGFSDSGSADWDKILDEYEQLVNKYYNYAEKVSKGNASAMTDALSMAEKAQSLADKLERADDNLSTAQANRLLKIQNKMAEAAMKMAGAASNVEDMMNDLQNMDVEELLNNMPDLPGF